MIVLNVLLKLSQIEHKNSSFTLKTNQQTTEKEGIFIDYYRFFSLKVTIFKFEVRKCLQNMVYIHKIYIYTQM